MKLSSAIFASFLFVSLPLAAQSDPRVRCWIEQNAYANVIGHQSAPITATSQGASTSAGSFELFAKLQNSASQLNVKIQLGSTASWATFNVGPSYERVSNALQIGAAVAVAYCDIHAN